MRWQEITAGIIVAACLVGIPAAALAYQNYRASQVVTMELSQWQYRPAQIRMRQGQELRLQLVARDVAHSLQIDGITNIEVRPGKVKEVIIRAEEPGVYRFRCNMFCGPQHAAMVGQIVVEE